MFNGIKHHLKISFINSNTILVTVHQDSKIKIQYVEYIQIQHLLLFNEGVPGLHIECKHVFKYNTCYCSTKASLDSTLSANTYSNTILVTVQPNSGSLLNLPGSIQIQHLLLFIKNSGISVRI